MSTKENKDLVRQIIKERDQFAADAGQTTFLV